MIKYYFEDFKVGDVSPIGERQITEEEIIAFATQFDPQPFHVDRERARESKFGGIIASGWHTCALAMRMMCDSYLHEAASLGSPGVDEVRWLKPVRPMDTLRGERETIETRPSTTKPDQGTVFSEWRIYNQHDELVMRMRGMGMFSRRPVNERQKPSGVFMREFDSIHELQALVGQEVAQSEWITIDQDRINQFADATGDHQWIHIDPARAAKGPFGAPVAHGFLTLSLLPMLTHQAFTIRNTQMGVNYGLNKVRFPSPVPVGSRVQGRFKLMSIEPLEPMLGVEGAQLVWQVTIVREGSDKPVCVAESVSRRYGS